ncbi:MAG: polysaccharide biosynthesis tyrosine autokinase [Actinomycetota bacterium]|nr:polysaccharide biosynthesis tyrosine autokinase [Actinomycetota bacterium]
MAVSTRPGMELRDYIAVLRRRKWLIILAGVLASLTALALSLAQSKVYEASVRLLLEPTKTVFESSGNTQGAVDVQTEIQRLESVPVQDAVRQKVGSAPPVSAVQVGTTRVMRLTTSAPTPRQAADFANAYADAYIGYRVEQAVDQLEKAAVPVQAKLDALEKEIAPLQEAIQNAPAGPAREAKSAEVGPRIAALLSVQTTFKSTLDKLQVDSALKSGGVQLVAPATLPGKPVRPTPVRNGALGLTVGLVFGIVLTFLFEHLDDSIKSKDDLESTVGDVTVLGVIPAVTSWKNRVEPRLVSKEEPSSPAAEAYRSLRTSIQFIGLDRKLQVLQVTSPNASEGKTTTLANLAVALTQAGQTVAVLSCDLRRPRIHEYFGLPNAVGFTTVLLGETPLSAALQRVPGLPRLVVLASGRLPPNPSELLSSRRTGDILVALRSQVDIILVDSPPVLPVTDAAVLSPRVDGTLLVAMAGQTTTKGLTRAMEVLRNVDTTVVGTVLNGATAESGYGYGYGYSYAAIEENGRGKRKNGRSATKDSKAPIES